MSSRNVLSRRRQARSSAYHSGYGLLDHDDDDDENNNNDSDYVPSESFNDGLIDLAPTFYASSARSSSSSSFPSSSPRSSSASASTSASASWISSLFTELHYMLLAVLEGAVMACWILGVGFVVALIVWVLLVCGGVVDHGPCWLSSRSPPPPPISNETSLVPLVDPITALLTALDSMTHEVEAPYSIPSNLPGIFPQSPGAGGNNTNMTTAFHIALFVEHLGNDVEDSTEALVYIALKAERYAPGVFGPADEGLRPVFQEARKLDWQLSQAGFHLFYHFSLLINVLPHTWVMSAEEFLIELGGVFTFWLDGGLDEEPQLTHEVLKSLARNIEEPAPPHGLELLTRLADYQYRFRRIREILLETHANLQHMYNLTVEILPHLPRRAYVIDDVRQSMDILNDTLYTKVLQPRRAATLLHMAAYYADLERNMTQYIDHVSEIGRGARRLLVQLEDGTWSHQQQPLLLPGRGHAIGKFADAIIRYRQLFPVLLDKGEQMSRMWYDSRQEEREKRYEESRKERLALDRILRKIRRRYYGDGAGLWTRMLDFLGYYD